MTAVVELVLGVLPMTIVVFLWYVMYIFLERRQR